MSADSCMERPELHGDGLKLAPRMECWRCGHEFSIDSSPSFIYCWSCDEEITEEIEAAAQSRRGGRR